MATYVSGRSGNQTKAKLAVEQLQRLGRYPELDLLSFAVAYTSAWARTTRRCPG
jgi:hypothetical protein